MHRSHPFFTRLGCGATVLLVGGLAAILYFFGGAPFSPGALTAASPRGTAPGGYGSHAEFGSDCGQCHGPWRGPEAERCLACHDNVGQQRETGTGLHGLMPNTGHCQRCHTDHEGADATITQVTDLTFDHGRLTAFSLNRHRQDYDGVPLACAGCHGPGRYEVADVDCISCHEAAEPTFMGDHVTLFGPDCLACHDGIDTMALFDHDAIFVLDGAHVNLECRACHDGATRVAAPRACVDCHAEPSIHAGQFGTECARCHTTQAWTPATLTGHTFPLDHGGEGQIACETCHEEAYTMVTCYNCHEHEPDEIARKHRDEGIENFADCASCHPTGLEHEGPFADD